VPAPEAVLTDGLSRTGDPGPAWVTPLSWVWTSAPRMPAASVQLARRALGLGLANKWENAHAAQCRASQSLCV
jgi:hypothetical protein